MTHVQSLTIFKNKRACLVGKVGDRGSALGLVYPVLQYYLQKLNFLLPCSDFQGLTVYPVSPPSCGLIKGLHVSSVCVCESDILR